MTKQDFQTLTQNVVLLDGATGSNLMAAGMPKGVCTEEWDWHIRMSSRPFREAM